MSFRSIFVGCTALTAVVASDAFVSYATAQGMDEIVVRARQREESLQDVPGTVAAFTELTLRRAGVERAEDFIGLTPGVSLVDAAEAGDTQVNIRGINGARDAENSFAFLIDGILYTNPSAFNREFTDLQQIEIFKGPQGAIYGRNAAAGAILVTTAKPDNDMSVKMRGSVANEDSYYFAGSISGPIVEDELWFRVSGDWRTTDGFYRNSFQNAPIVDDFSNYNLNGRLLWEPNPDLSVDMRARYGEIDAASISFNAAFALSDLSGILGVPTLFEDVNDHDFVFQPNVDPSNKQEALETSIKVDYDLDFATLSGWFLYSDIEQNFLADGTSGAFGFFFTEASCISSVAERFADGPPLPSPQFYGPTPGASFLGPYTSSTCDGYQYQVRNQDDVSFEFRLTSPSDQPFRWQGGFYYLDIQREVGVATLVDPGIDNLPASLVNPFTEALVHDEFNSRVYAIFGSVQYDVTEEIELSFALRYDNEKRQVDNLIDPTLTSTFIDFDGGAPGSPLNPGLVPAFNPNLLPDGSIPDQEETFEQIQPKISATWDITPELTAFANWGIGFKSGGFNNIGSAATIDAFINPTVIAGGGTPVTIEDIFEKEKSSAFEIGFKSSLLDGRVNIEGAGYYTNVDDMQFFEFFVGPFGLLRVVNNIDEVRIIGGELAVNANVTDWLTLFAGGNYTGSKIKKNTARPDTVGNKSPYTPDYTINAGAQVQYNLFGSEVDLVGRLDFQYVGPTWFHTVQENTVPTGFLTADFSRTQRDPYHTLNLRVGFEHEIWSVAAFAKNLTNEKYLEEVIPAPEFGGSFIHPGARRLFGIEVACFF